MPTELLITPNALINVYVSAKNPHRTYLHSFRCLVEQIENQGVKLYMTEFDFALSFILPRIFGYDSTEYELERIIQSITILSINEDVLDTASKLTINPSDAVRIGAVIEHCLHGVITWEPDHFLPSFGMNGMSSCCCYHRIRYEELSVESGDREAEDIPSSIEIDIYSVNGFLLYCANENSPELSSVNHQEYRTRIPVWHIAEFHYSGRSSRSIGSRSYVSVEIEFDCGRFENNVVEGTEGLIETIIMAISGCVTQYLNGSWNLESISAIEIAVPPVLLTDSWGEVLITLATEEYKFFGRGYQHDFPRAVADAYLNALAAIMNSHVFQP
jgi:hypothetical protein